MATKSVCQSCGSSDFAPMTDGVHELCLSCGARHVMDAKPSMPGIVINVGGDVSGSIIASAASLQVHNDEPLKLAVKCPSCRKNFLAPKRMQRLIGSDHKFKGGEYEEKWQCPHCRRELKWGDRLEEVQFSTTGNVTKVGNISGSSGIAIGPDSSAKNDEVVVTGEEIWREAILLSE